MRPDLDAIDQIDQDHQAAAAIVMDVLITAGGEWVLAEEVRPLADDWVLMILRRLGAIAVKMQPGWRLSRISAFAVTTLGERWWLGRKSNHETNHDPITAITGSKHAAPGLRSRGGVIANHAATTEPC